MITADKGHGGWMAFYGRENSFFLPTEAIFIMLFAFNDGGKFPKITHAYFAFTLRSVRSKCSSSDCCHWSVKDYKFEWKGWRGGSMFNDWIHTREIIKILLSRSNSHHSVSFLTSQTMQSCKYFCLSRSKNIMRCHSLPPSVLCHKPRESFMTDGWWPERCPDPPI